MYRTPVQFQTVASTRDDLGQLQDTLTNALRTGGTVRAMSATERARSGIASAPFDITVRVRKSPSSDAIDVSDVMVISSITYDITGKSVGGDYIEFAGRQRR